MSEQISDDRESVSRAKLRLLQEVDALFSENPERVFEFEGRKPKKGVYEQWAMCRTQQDIIYRIDAKKELDEYGTMIDFELKFKAQNHDVLSFLSKRLIEDLEITLRKNPIEPVRKKFKCYGSSVHFMTGRHLLESQNQDMKVYELERFTEQIRAGTLLFDGDAAEIVKKVTKTRSARVLERLAHKAVGREVEY